MSERLVLGSQVDGLLDRLYARHGAQNDAVGTYFTARAAEGSLDLRQFDERTHEFLGDKLIAPHLREGAVIICDNTLQFREAYSEYFDFVHDPRNGLRTMTLPFEGGLEFTVRAR
jgi:hypothetical protein